MSSWFVSFVFIVFAWLSFLLVKTVEDNLVENERKTSREPEYYLESMLRTTTDSEGAVKNI